MTSMDIMVNKVTVAIGAEIVGTTTGTINRWVRKGLINDYGTKGNRLVDVNEIKKQYREFHNKFTFADMAQDDPNQKMKECKKCHRVLPASNTYFNKKSDSKDGLQVYCRECNSNYGKQFREDKPNYTKEYYAENKWQQLINTHKSQARAEGLPCDYSVSDWLKVLEYFDYKCAYCGSTEDLQVEHVIPKTKEGGLVKDNIVCACGKCNQSKKSKDLEEWAADNNIDLTKVKEYIANV